MSELKRCPFCNGEVMLMFMNEKSFDDCVWDESIGNVSTWFKCYKCDSEFFHDEPIDTPEKQAEWWNTRIPMQNIVERLEEYRDDFMNDIYEELREDADNCRANRIIDRFDEAIEIVKEEGGLNELQNNE